MNDKERLEFLTEQIWGLDKRIDIIKKRMQHSRRNISNNMCNMFNDCDNRADKSMSVYDCIKHVTSAVKNTRRTGIRI